MQINIDLLKDSCERKRLFLLCLLTTLIIGLIAHGYAFLNLIVGHDALYEMYIQDSAEWKISLGRFLNPLERFILGDVVSLPWLNGILGLLLIAVAAWQTAVVFRLTKRWQAVAIASIFTTGTAISTLIASFASDLVPNMLALVAAMTAALCWDKLYTAFSWKRCLAATVCVFIVLGLYQCYISVTVVVMMLLSIKRLLEGTEPKKVFCKGITGILILIIGGGIYLLSVKVVCCATGVELVSGRYNSLTKLWDGDNNILARILPTYKMTVSAFISRTAIKNAFLWSQGASFVNCMVQLANACLIVISVLAFIRLLIAKRKMKWQSYALTAILIILLPLALNMTYIASGIRHELTRFAYCFIYVFMIWLVEHTAQAPKKKRFSIRKEKLAVLLLAGMTVIVFANMRTANAAYLERDLEASSTLSVMTRVLTQIEATDGYELGKTEVAFIGNPGKVQSGAPGFDDISVFGFEYKSQITSQAKYRAYFANILQYPINIVQGEQYDALLEDERVIAMPIFPEQGSVAVLDGIVVVKMS